MNYEELADGIIKNVGGVKNINGFTHCATRLRFTLNDDKKVNKGQIEGFKEVYGTNYSGGQFQIIIGTDVANVYSTIIKKYNINDDNSNGTDKKEKLLGTLFDTIAGIFTPILPAIMAGGMLKAFLAVLVVFKLISNTSNIYTLLTFISDASFYFLPVFLGVTAAQKFKCNPFLGAMLGGVLIHPTFTGLVSAGEPFSLFGMNLPLYSYGSSVIPIILSVWFMSYIQKGADRIMPKVLKVIGVPLITILITAPIMLMVIAPLGNLVGSVLLNAVNWVASYLPWFPGLFLGAFAPFIIMTGMHYAFMPVMLSQMAAGGETFLGPASLASNMAQAGATLAVAFKSKNVEIKQIATSTGFTALMGITEPAMYGVTLKNKKVMYCAMVGGAIGGLYAGITGIFRVAFGATGLATIAVWITPDITNLVNAVITILLGFIIAFLLTYFIGYKEDTVTKKVITNKEIDILKPLKGEVKELKEVNDPTFANEIIGKGVAIYPSEGNLYSPVDGVVSAIFPTKHAIGITSDDGIEVLIHIGLDTVRLKGEFFESHVTDKQIVKKGDLLVTFDRDKILEKGYDLITPILITNLDSSKEIVAFDDVDSDILFTIKGGK